MIDQEDADLIAIGWPAAGGFLTLIGLILFIVVQVAACENEKACAEKSCASGSRPKLMAHECLCVSGAK